MNARRTIPTTIITPSGLIVKATLEQGRDTNQTWSGKRGSEWHLEIGESQPTLGTFCWDSAEDVGSKAAAGFDAGDVWVMYAESMTAHAYANGLVVANPNA